MASVSSPRRAGKTKKPNAVALPGDGSVVGFQAVLSWASYNGNDLFINLLPLPTLLASQLQMPFDNNCGWQKGVRNVVGTEGLAFCSAVNDSWVVSATQQRKPRRHETTASGPSFSSACFQRGLSGTLSVLRGRMLGSQEKVSE